MLSLLTFRSSLRTSTGSGENFDSIKRILTWGNKSAMIAQWASMMMRRLMQHRPCVRQPTERRLPCAV